MYTFEDFIDKLKIEYDYRKKKFEYKYYPEDNELWINGKYNYLKITDDEIIIRVNQNSYDLNDILSKFKDLENVSKYNNWNTYKFKYYLNDIYNSLINSVSKELVDKLNKILIRVRYHFRVPLDHVKFWVAEDDSPTNNNNLGTIINFHRKKCFYEVNLCRDDEGYFYTIESSDRRGYERLVKDVQDGLIYDSDSYKCTIIIR